MPRSFIGQGAYSSSACVYGLNSRTMLKVAAVENTEIGGKNFV